MEAAFTPATHWIERRSVVIMRESNGGEMAIVWPVGRGRGRGEKKDDGEMASKGGLSVGNCLGF